MTEQPDYYAILNVSPNSTLPEIKRAFRRLARQYHPDLNPNNLLAKMKFQEASAAYEILGDPEKRFQYDQRINATEMTEPTSSLTAQDYYVKGVQKYLIRHYREAIDYFNQAIDLRPNFLEAYLQRCEVYFHLRSYPEVLEDCYQIIQLDPNIWQAHYYQGRVRQKLGYLESAIEAYSQGISVNPQEPRIYYDRGLTYQELNQKKLALNDFTKASDFYFKQSRIKGYRSAQHKIKKLRSLGISEISDVKKILTLISLTIFQIMLNPSGEILPKFSKLRTYQKLVIGFSYGLIAELLISLTRPDYRFLGLLTFAVLMIWMMLINFETYRYLNRVAVIFVAGLFSLSLSFVAVTWSLVNSLPFWLTLSLMMSLGVSSFLILYCSFTQIFNLSEQQSTYLMPLTFMLILGLSYFFFLS